MGDIADQMLDGSMCSECGVCFAKAHGHPVLCAHCFGKKPKGDKTPKAREREL